MHTLDVSHFESIKKLSQLLCSQNALFALPIWLNTAGSSAGRGCFIADRKAGHCFPLSWLVGLFLVQWMVDPYWFKWTPSLDGKSPTIYGMVVDGLGLISYQRSYKLSAAHGGINQWPLINFCGSWCWSYPQHSQGWMDGFTVLNHLTSSNHGISSHGICSYSMW